MILKQQKTGRNHLFLQEEGTRQLLRTAVKDYLRHAIPAFYLAFLLYPAVKLF
jgi:hypothetical protein